FASGVDHNSPSIPGVLWPRFAVTRLMASAFALVDFVIRRCSCLTLRQSDSLAAFAMRACNLLTRPDTADHSIECHWCHRGEPTSHLSVSMYASTYQKV